MGVIEGENKFGWKKKMKDGSKARAELSAKGSDELK